MPITLESLIAEAEADDWYVYEIYSNPWRVTLRREIYSTPGYIGYGQGPTLLEAFEMAMDNREHPTEHNPPTYTNLIANDPDALTNLRKRFEPKSNLRRRI